MKKYAIVRPAKTHAHVTVAFEIRGAWVNEWNGSFVSAYLGQKLTNATEDSL